MGRDYSQVGAGAIDMRFKNKSAIVTGASSGIGRAVAERLSSEGASIIAVGRDKGRLEALNDALTSSGGKIQSIACDLSKPENRAYLCESVGKMLDGGIDVLVNAAGVHSVRPVAGNTSALWREMMELNVVAPSDIIAKLIPKFITGSSVVNISSVAGLMASPGSSVYASTKAALISFTRSAAVELAHRGIRVNAVLPGLVKTAMMDNMLRFFTKEQRTEIERRHLMGYGTPEDVAAAVAFIASSESKWITGCSLVTDGGFSIA